MKWIVIKNQGCSQTTTATAIQIQCTYVLQMKSKKQNQKQTRQTAENKSQREIWKIIQT